MVRITKYDNLNAYSDQKDLFTSRRWLEVIAKTYGFEFYQVYDTVSDNSVFFTLLNDLKGKRLVSLPFCDYIDTLTISRASFKRIVNEIRKAFPNLPIILKTNYLQQELLGKNVRNAYYHTIKVSDYRSIQRNYTPAFRRGVNKALKNGVKINYNQTYAGLQDFFRLYAKLRLTKFNSLPQPFSFFKNIFEVFIKNDSGFLLNATYKEKVIASIVVLKHKNTLFYKFGASDIDFLNHRPNNLVFDALIRFAAENGYSEINLGLSGASNQYKGLVRFKEAMGGAKHVINYYRLSPADYNSDRENVAADYLQKLTRLIVSSYQKDEKIINEFSELLYRNFA